MKHCESRKVFDGMSGGADWTSFSAEEALLVEEFMAHWAIVPGRRILEPGCGTGRLTEKLAAAAGRQGRVTAFDISAGMIGQARERSLPPQVQLVHGDVEALPPGERYDQIICFNVFPHLEPVEAVLDTLVRRLNPGGTFEVAHTASRHRINSIHRAGPPAIRQHLIAGLERFKTLFEARGLCWEGGEDSDRCFRASARKPL